MPDLIRHPGFPVKTGIPSILMAPDFRRDNAYRGREGRLVSVPPPSEPDWRISRIRLSGRWFYLQED
jgi:hypothetical protein